MLIKNNDTIDKNFDTYQNDNHLTCQYVFMSLLFHRLLDNVLVAVE